MNHIEQNFDSFLKEENIEIKEDEIRERVNNMLKDSCMEFLQKKIESINENYFKEQIEGVLKEAHDKGAIISDYKIKRTKLPRKLKKRYKKESKICFDVEYKKPIYEYKITIPIEESEVKMKKDFVLTVENFDSNIDKVVKYIQKHPPKNNDEFKDYTRRFYGVELNCKVTVYLDNNSMGVQYQVIEQEDDYCQGELYQLWEDKFGQYDGLKILLNACFGKLCCGGVASHHYGQTEPLSNEKREILRHWDVFDNDLKLLQSALKQRKQIEDIFGYYPF